MSVIEFDIKYLGQVVDLIDQYRAFYSFDRSTNETKKFLLNILEKDENKLFLAIDEATNQVMGFVNLYPCYSTLSLKRLWILNDIGVSEQHRGKGLSKALIERAIQFARETGAVRIELKTDKANKRALNLYESIGFKIDNDNVYYRVPV